MKHVTIAKNISQAQAIDNATSKNNQAKSLPKQKVLLPTLKEQQRYVVYRVKYFSSIPNSDFGLVHNNILLQCNNMLGIFDGAKAGLMSAKYDAKKLSGIIRVNNDYVDKLKLCLGLIKEINSEKVLVDCIYVSGMLNKAVDKMAV